MKKKLKADEIWIESLESNTAVASAQCAVASRVHCKLVTGH